jgi:hypothetical protein
MKKAARPRAKRRKVFHDVLNFIETMKGTQHSQQKNQSTLYILPKSAQNNHIVIYSFLYYPSLSSLIFFNTIAYILEALMKIAT